MLNYEIWIVTAILTLRGWRPHTYNDKPAQQQQDKEHTKILSLCMHKTMLHPPSLSIHMQHGFLLTQGGEIVGPKTRIRNQCIYEGAITADQNIFTSYVMQSVATQHEFVPLLVVPAEFKC